ncbi:MAG: hypothetical protein MUO23_03330 [Anaerolineales bacterium]|nr:hypothetical protein [Anaerolineales bacterium]
MSRRRKESKPGAKAPPAAALGQFQSRSPSEFAPDYSYVKKDLRRIALLGGGILAVLLVLAILLN